MRRTHRRNQPTWLKVKDSSSIFLDPSKSIVGGTQLLRLGHVVATKWSDLAPSHGARSQSCALTPLPLSWLTEIIRNKRHVGWCQVVLV